MTIGPPARAGSLVGTVALTRLALRRDRVRLAIWVVVLGHAMWQRSVSEAVITAGQQL